MSLAPAGYSGKTVIAKLGLKPGQTLAVINPPEHIDALVAPLPGGSRMVEGYDPAAELVWAFVADRAALEAVAPRIVGAAQGAMIWISWPRKASKKFIDLTEDGVRDVLLPTGWVDVKVAAVDTDWSGLKFLRRKT